MTPRVELSTPYPDPQTQAAQGLRVPCSAPSGACPWQCSLVGEGVGHRPVSSPSPSSSFPSALRARTEGRATLPAARATPPQWGSGFEVFALLSFAFFSTNNLQGSGELLQAISKQ